LRYGGRTSTGSRIIAASVISVFCGALVIAGLFTLLPGRIMHAVVFGP
jgi:uncharacterized membrane protein